MLDETFGFFHLRDIAPRGVFRGFFFGFWTLAADMSQPIYAFLSFSSRPGCSALRDNSINLWSEFKRFQQGSTAHQQSTA